jgi:hypothetical protein
VKLRARQLSGRSWRSVESWPRRGPLLGVYVSKADEWLGFVFIAEITAGVPGVPAGGEIVEVGWFDPTDLPTPCRSLATALIADAAEGRRGVYREL